METRLRLLALLGCLAALLAGCGRAPAPLAPVEIIGNPAQIEGARKAWARQRAAALDALLAQPAQVRSYDRRSVALLRENRAVALPALHQLHQNETRPADQRLQAALALRFLEVVVPPEELISLAGKSEEAAAAWFGALEEIHPEGTPLPVAARRFVAQSVGSPAPRVRAAALWTAGRHRVEEASEAVFSIVKRGDAAMEEPRLLEAAARLRPSAELLALLTRRLKAPALLGGPTGLGAVNALSEAATDPELRRQAAAACVHYLKQQGDHRWVDGDTLAAVERIARVDPPEQARALLTDLIREGRWRAMRSTALSALERLAPGEARQLAGESGLELESLHAGEPAPPPLPPAECARLLVTHRLLTPDEAQAALSRRGPAASGEERSPDSVAGFLARANRFFAFDVETGMEPNRHDELVEDFALASAGRFQPEAVLEEYTKSAQDSDTGTYALQFIHRGRLYRIAPRDLGDWYDVEAVLAIVHRALADAGSTERFVPLETGDQTAAFVFGPPEAVRAVAPQLGLRLGADPDQARKTGKAFEEKAMKALD